MTYIVQWHIGRLPCPAQYRHTPIERQFATGRFGGKRTIEHRTDSPTEAKEIWSQDRFSREVYVLEQGHCRHRIQKPWKL